MAEEDPPIFDTSKIGQMIADAKAELKLRGIDTTGKIPAEILRMAREARNQSATAERIRRFPPKTKST